MDKQTTFLKWFEIHRLLANVDVDIKKIFIKLQNTLTTKQLKTILSFGIRQCYTDLSTHDTTIHDIHHALNSIEISTKPNANTSIPISSNNNRYDSTSSMKKVFEVDSLHCKMFEYLDFDSIKICSMINLQWLYISYDPRSCYYFNIRDHYSSNTKGSWRCANYNILRFRNAKIVNLRNWKHSSKLLQLFCNLKYFNKIHEIIIDRPHLHEDIPINPSFSFLIGQIIKNNLNSNNISCNSTLETIGFHRVEVLKSFWDAIGGSCNTTLKHLVLDRIQKEYGYKLIEDGDTLDKVCVSLMNLETLTWNCKYYEDSIQCFAPIVSRISQNANNKLKQLKFSVTKDTFIDDKLTYGFNAICKPLENVLLEINSHSHQSYIYTINDKQINNLCNLLVSKNSNSYHDLTMNHLSMRLSKYGQMAQDRDTIIIKILTNINNRLATNIDINYNQNNKFSIDIVENNNDKNRFTNNNLSKLTIDFDDLILKDIRQLNDMIVEICRLYNYHGDNLQLNLNLRYQAISNYRTNVDWLIDTNDIDKEMNLFVKLFTMMQRALTCWPQKQRQENNNLIIQIIMRAISNVKMHAWAEQFIAIIEKLNFEVQAANTTMKQYDNLKEFNKIAIKINWRSHNMSICIGEKSQVIACTDDTVFYLG